MSYRNRELANLFVVAIITGLGFASVYIARQDVVSTGSLSYAFFFFALYVAAHVIARLTVPQADPYLLPMAALLTAIGVTEIYRLDPDNAFRQGLWVVVGVIAFAGTLLAFRHDYRRLESYKYLCGLTAIGLLVLPALPVIGQPVNGARLWVRVGGIQFQPGELAKIMLIVFLAGYLREKREVLAQEGLGKGVFATTNGHELIPYLSTDFIFSALAQELGLVGAAALMLVYMLFCLRGFRIALLAQDGFSKLLAVGLTFGFALQTFIIVGGVLRLIPLTGITLPFVSYGGSSVIANFVLLAGLLLVSHRANSLAQLPMEGRP